jgi:hypothetical protein
VAQKLVDVVGAIADGREIDWQSTQCGLRSDRARRRVQALRTLAAVVTAHRTVQPMRRIEPRVAASEIPSRSDQAIGTWGSYRLSDFLASGTSADVYRAYDRSSIATLR